MSPHRSSTVKTSRRNKAQKAPAARFSSGNLIEEVEDLGRELSGAVGPKEVIYSLALRLVERYGVSACGIWMVNEADGALELDAEAGKPSLPPALKKAAIDRGILGKAIQHGLPQILSKKDRSRDELTEWAKKHKLSLLAAYPLLNDSKVLGVLLVACAKALGEPLLSLFRLHARLASVALRDAQLISSTQRTLNKLSFLVGASKALNSTLDLSELLSRILDVAKTQVEAERGTIFLVDEKAGEIWSLIAHGIEKEEIRLPIGRGIAGHVAKTGEIVNIPDAYQDPRFTPEVDKRTGYRTRTILCLPIRNKAGKIIAALQLLNKKHGPFTEDDTDFLLTLSTHMALALENAQLHRALLEKERMEKELALARGIQRGLLPDKAPFVEGFDIAVLNEPCYEVGGDYYDFLSLGANTLLVVIADVEGKGVSSALVMSNLQATLRALVLHLHSLNEVAEGLNQMILTDTRAQKFLSIFLGLIDLRRKSIHYINCGHVPPIIVSPSHDDIELREGGVVIGLFENAQYERGQAKFRPGDVLVLCTDGITESMDAQHEEYGIHRLIRCVRESAHKKAADLVTAVSADVERFSREGTHVDDKVMIAIKVAETDRPSA